MIGTPSGSRKALHRATCDASEGGSRAMSEMWSPRRPGRRRRGRAEPPREGASPGVAVHDAEHRVVLLRTRSRTPTERRISRWV